MDKTYIFVLFAEKPSDIYVALAKTCQTPEHIESYLSDPYLAHQPWKYEMIRAYLDCYKNKTDTNMMRS